MGITNVRSPGDILLRCREASSRSHMGKCIRAVIPDVQRAMFMEIAFSTERDLLKWRPLLRRGLDDHWIQQGEKVVVAAPSNVSIPKIQVCPLLHSDLTENNHELAIFIVVQGKEGSALAKMVVKDNIGQLASQLFFEACNGLSVVFSGIMRKDDAEKLGKAGLVFKTAEKLDELLGNDGRHEEATISKPTKTAFWFCAEDGRVHSKHLYLSNTT